MITRRTLLVVALVMFLLLTGEILAIGWANDRASCLRQIPARRTSNQRARVFKRLLEFEAVHMHAPSLRAEKANVTLIRIPRCNKLLPDE